MTHLLVRCPALSLGVSGERLGLSDGVQIVLVGFSDRRLMIGQSLAFDALKHLRGPLRILYFKPGAIVVSEIKLLQIAMQMGFVDRMINSYDASL
jgi:hypothetical protein